jgi:hypothetical protein
MRHKLVMILLGVSALLATAGCAKTTPAEAKLSRELSIPADMPVKNLGSVELFEGTPKQVNLGAGKDCTITATVITNGMLQMNVAYESTMDKAEGSKTAHASKKENHRFLLPLGRQCAVTVDHMALVFRPALSQQ